MMLADNINLGRPQAAGAWFHKVEEKERHEGEGRESRRSLR